jgi:hypothetical protein
MTTNKGGPQRVPLGRENTQCWAAGALRRKAATAVQRRFREDPKRPRGHDNLMTLHTWSWSGDGGITRPAEAGLGEEWSGTF